MRHVLSAAICGVVGFAVWVDPPDGASATDFDGAAWAHMSPSALHALPELQQDSASTDAQYGFVELDEGTLVARHERAGLTVRIDSQGAHAEGMHHVRWSFGLKAFGCDEEPQPVGDGLVEKDGDQRVLVRHPGVDEWYTNGRHGFEQGFDVPEPPECATQQARGLTFVLGSPVDLRVEVVDGGVRLVDADGHIRFGMGSLRAEDSTGRALTSHFEVRDNELSLWVDTRHARYPLVVR